MEKKTFSALRIEASTAYAAAKSAADFAAAKLLFEAARKSSKTAKDRAAMAAKVADCGVRAGESSSLAAEAAKVPRTASGIVSAAAEAIAAKRATKPAEPKADKPAKEPKAPKEPKAKKEKTGPTGAERLEQRILERCKKNGLKPGQVLEHKNRGEVVTTCIYRGPREWEYSGKTYTSISDAANSAAARHKMKSRSLNGWFFWGVEKREKVEA